ncbi:unnamed protein product [Camellia sinensis]
MIHRLIIAVEHPQKPRVVTPFPAPKIMDLPQFQGDHKESLYRGTYRPNVYLGIRASMERLRWYLETAMRTNPGSPLLFVDGTFLEGRYKGHLLAATSKDGNQGLFPLAFAIVDAENQDNWMWFLSQLLKAVGSGRRLTFVSDRQHGLLDAFSVVFPNAHHAYCLNHLKRNLIDKLVGLRTNYKLFMEKKLVDSLELAKSWDVIVASDTTYCFRESYKESVYPVPSSERFDFDGASSSVIKPPITKKQPGRNKKKRIPSRGENVKQIKCGRCLKYGNHNKKTCKAAI